MELPDAAYEGSKLRKIPGTETLGQHPAGQNPGSFMIEQIQLAARVVIVAGSDFGGTSPKLFWPETLIYSLPGAELNQMLTLVVAIKVRDALRT